LGLAVLFFSSVSGASIIDWECADDGDGAVECTASWDQDTYELGIDGVQNWSPGHVLGSFTTDTEEDPAVWILNMIENDTAFDWTGFKVNISMSKTFNISNVSGPDGWTFGITSPVENAGTWTGIIEWDMGTGSAVAIGESGSFNYKLTFLGSIQYCQEMIPLPEPGTLGLLALGGLAFLRRKSR